MSLVISGSLRERVGAIEEIARPLSIVVKPISVEHSDVFGKDGARLLQIPFDDRMARDLAQVEPSLARWRWLHGGPEVPAFLRLLSAVRGGASEAVKEMLVIDVIGSLIRVERVRRAEPPRWLRRVRAAIHDSADIPSVAALAVIGGVHRVHLARQFRRFYDCSVSEYARRHRVQRAAENIARARATMSSLAVEAGFSDQPHFCRVFRHSTGLTPSEFRALSRR